MTLFTFFTFLQGLVNGPYRLPLESLAIESYEPASLGRQQYFPQTHTYPQVLYPHPWQVAPVPIASFSLNLVHPFAP